jgi:radial spoke head protein 4A
MFTGNLEQNINALGKFDGQEKHLLKCVIARITHSCELAPKGLYKLNEENPNILEIEEEFKNPEVAEMNSVENWVHLNSHILNQGRASYYIDPKLTE